MSKKSIICLSSSSSAFTMVEILVTVSLLILFTVGAATYNRSADQQVSLYREQGKVINKVYDVRSFSISAYNRGGEEDVPCGYGIYIPPGNTSQLIVFKDLPDMSDECPSYPEHTSLVLYDGEEENVEVIDIKDITMTADFTELLFVPPDPQVYTSRVTFPVSITLSASRVATDLVVSINSFGQITTTQLAQ